MPAQLQTLRGQSNDTASESTAISRRQAELEAANNSLQHAAQNFSQEWKSFLGYAMKIKQQGTSGSRSSEKDLEDLLLKTQGGLIMLRDLGSRRKQQWKEVFERCGYQHPSVVIDSDSQTGNQASSTPPRWLQELLSKLLSLNQDIVTTAHCAATTTQLTTSHDKDPTSVCKDLLSSLPELVKHRAAALETHHRLQHALDNIVSGKVPTGIDELIRVEDVNSLMQFTYLQHQQNIVLERFCLRLKWLPTSHHYHLRQRMLMLTHQQKTKNTPQPTAYRDSKGHLHCPLFILTTPRFASELKALGQKFSLVIPDGFNTRDNKRSTEDCQALKQGAEDLLASVLSAPLLEDDMINADSSLEAGLDTLVHNYTGNSRWELIQRGFLGEYDFAPGNLEKYLAECRNDRRIDTLLANEWELLGLNDVGYLSTRLEALSRAHMDRAKVDLEKQDSKHARESPLQSADIQRNLGLSHSWNPDALYSLYVLRVCSCRAKRLSLLRLLNYFHFVQLSHGGNNFDVGKDDGTKHSLLQQEAPARASLTNDDSSSREANPWSVRKCDQTGDFIIIRQISDGDKEYEGVGGENSDNEGREFIFAAARRDLEVLELQMLRTASIFISKQEYDSLPTSPLKRTSNGETSEEDFVTPIDRLQVLRDIYDCEVAFQEAKLQLLETLLNSGLLYAPQRRDLSALGFSALEGQADTFEDIVFPSLRRRPLIDFSHAYFFESYAAETILLELQATLVQQMNQHFQRLDWCPLRKFGSVDEEHASDEQRQWIYRQILGTNSLVRLYSTQNELTRESDEKWFAATSVGEYHALQHTLLEQTLVVWSLIIKVELPGRSILPLERTAGDILTGGGWHLVLPPQILSDVCKTLHLDSTGKKFRTLTEWLARAIELEGWRHQLASGVYEAHLLERIHNFQFTFVKQVAGMDSVVGGEQARHLQFFFDFGKSDNSRSLQPLAAELETPMFHTTNTSASSTNIGRSGDNKTVSEWLRDQLSVLQAYPADSEESIHENDEIATQAQRSAHWRCSVLLLQQQYVSYLDVSARYQDTIGADVFEFAGSYPYLCLAAALTPAQSMSSGEENNVAMDINTVRTKYAKEIADKMTDEMRTSCFPYWKRLESIKQQLQERYTAMSSKANDVLTTAFASLQSAPRVEVDMHACARFLEDESVQRRHIMALNQHLQRLRNEKMLMCMLSPATRARCAFTPHSTDSSGNIARSGDDEQPSGLTKWLMVKLHQLKVDLQIHERPKVDQLLLTPPALSSSPPASSHRAARQVDGSKSPPVLGGSSVDTQNLLQTIPTFRYLLKTFATTANHERPIRDASDGVAASARAIRLHDHREETLRVLLSIFNNFNCSLDLVRIQCGSHFSPPLQVSSQYTMKTVAGVEHNGLGRLERWQTQYHRDIRQLLDQVACKFSSDATTAIGDLFAIHPDNLQSQQNAVVMRRELCGALRETNEHLLRVLECATKFAFLQTFQQDAGVRIRKRRQRLNKFQSILSMVAAATNDASHQRHDTNFDKGGIPPFPEAIRDMVIAAERALFGEARPRYREREWQAFNDAVGKYDSRDSVYVTALTKLLELHKIFIDENCRNFSHDENDVVSSSIANKIDAENHALIVLGDLWQRYHLPAWDSPRNEKFASRSVAPIVAGENLDLKKRLLGNTDLISGMPSTSGPESVLSSNECSYALQSLQMGATTALTQFCSTNVLILPPLASIETQLVYLQLSVELAWVQTDIQELGDQYQVFLLHRKTQREHQRARKPSKSSQTAGVDASASASSLLLKLSEFFHEDGVRIEKTLPDSSSKGEIDTRLEWQEISRAFVIPAAEMARFLHGINVHCVENAAKQFNLHADSMRQLQNRCQAVILDHQKLDSQCKQFKLEERIRREAFSVDHAFHLYFEVEALRKQLAVMEARKEYDQQTLRCELDADYDNKLHAMHLELLNKQQKFAEYRTTMQRELQTVIQGAHSQFVDHLLDYSGSVPSATKASVTTLLRGQQDVAKIKSENVAMKQALLKVQALGDMQHQTQNAARDRERLLTQRFATAEALQRTEIDQLQAYVKQLEGNLCKLSQEKTYFQVKWTTAQKQMEVTAQRRREAKARALSASHTRGGSAAPDILPTDSSLSPIISRPTCEDNESDTEDSECDHFYRPRTAASKATTAGDDHEKQELQRLETQYLNSTRHYQNEIRRLQQQLAREAREKAAIAEKLTSLKQQESTASFQSRDLLPFVEDSLSPNKITGEELIDYKDHHQLANTPRRIQSASPRMSLRPTSSGSVHKPPPKRSNSTFSPRASMLRAQVAAGPGSGPPQLVACNETSNPSTTPSRPTTASGTPRKFQVVKRDAMIGGVLGVPNALSVREPLPYR